MRFGPFDRRRREQEHPVGEKVFRAARSHRFGWRKRCDGWQI